MVDYETHSAETPGEPLHSRRVEPVAVHLDDTRFDGADHTDAVEFATGRGGSYAFDPDTISDLII